MSVGSKFFYKLFPKGYKHLADKNSHGCTLKDMKVGANICTYCNCSGASHLEVCFNFMRYLKVQVEYGKCLTTFDLCTLKAYLCSEE